MGVSQKAVGTTSSVSTTPVTIVSTTDAGEYELWLDCSNMTSNDVFHVYAEGDVSSGGTDRRLWYYALSGAQVEVCRIFPIVRSVHAVTFYIVKIAGDDMTFAYSLREITASISGTVDANVTQFGGVAGTFSGGRPQVNTTHIAGTSQTARDLGASVLLSSGTGTGQISLSSGAVLLQATQTGVTIPTVTTVTNAPSDSSGVTTLLSRLTSTRAGYLDNLSAGAVATAAALTSAAGDITTLLGKLTGITSLAQWLGLLAGKQTGNSTALTEIRATGAGSGTYDPTTDSPEAIRDRGDAAWTTGTAPTAAANASAVRTELATELARIDAAVSTRSTLDAAAVNAEVDAALSDVGLTTTVTGRIDAAISSRLASASYTTPPTVGAIADAVWDEATVGHATAGSFGEYIASADEVANANSALTALAGDVTSLQTSVGDIATQLTSVQDDAVAIRERTDNLPDDPADASVIADAFAVTDGLIATVDTTVDAIKAKTDGLSSDPADASDIATAFAVTDAAIAALQTDVDTLESRLTATRAGYLDNLDATISSRLASASYTAPPSAATNASAVRTELAVELARIDAAISTRSTYAGADTSGTTTLLSRIGGAITISSGRVAANVERWNGTAPGNLDSNGFVPANAAAVNGNTTRAATLSTWLDNNRLDAAISTRSTFDATADDVTVGTNNDKTGYSLASSQTFSTSGSVGSVVGSVGSVEGNVGGNVAGTVGFVNGDVYGRVLGNGEGTFAGVGVRANDASGNAIATAASITTLTGYVDTEVAAIKTVTDRLDDTLEDNAGTYRFTAAALAEAPSGGGGGSSDWTSDEKTQIRHRLGIDGTAAAPSATPSLAAAADLAAVDSVVDAINLKTTNLPDDPASQAKIDLLDGRLTDARAAKLDNLDATITSRMATFTYTAAPTVEDIWSSTNRTLTASGLDSIVIETGTNARQALSIIGAAVGGVLAGAATTSITIAGMGVGTNRITATVDADGNRSSVTLNRPS